MTFNYSDFGPEMEKVEKMLNGMFQEESHKKAIKEAFELMYELGERQGHKKGYSEGFKKGVLYGYGKGVNAERLTGRKIGQFSKR